MFKHLHGRGEDRAILACDCAMAETPPRTWRRRIEVAKDGVVLGNTSTDVEKTVDYF